MTRGFQPTPARMAGVIRWGTGREGANGVDGVRGGRGAGGGPAQRKASASRGPARECGRLILVTGGARSGKSSFAERLALDSGRRVVYLATGGAGDAEMAARIALHRKGRPAAWETVEEQQGVGRVVRRRGGRGVFIIVDCLTLLVSNLMLRAAGPGMQWGEAGQVDEGLAARAGGAVDAELGRLLAAARQATEAGGDVAIVSNEVGWGLAPPYPLGRLFRDLMGQANRAVAAAADEVYLMVAGIPLRLRGTEDGQAADRRGEAAGGMRRERTRPAPEPG